MKEKLSKMTFISVLCDASNHKAIKMLPVLIRGFIPEEGIVVFKLEIAIMTNETAKTITEKVMNAIRKYNVTAKVACFVADNCNTNFGGFARGGQNNVFYLLKEKLGRKLIGIGCEGHMVSNAFGAAADQLPIDIEAIVVKIYRYFSIYTVRTESLKKFLEEAGEKFKVMTRHSNTRFLSLSPCIENLIDCHDGLFNFFKSPEAANAPQLIKDFFANPDHLFWLQFLLFQMKLSNEYILKIEGKDATSFEIGVLMRELMMKVSNRKSLDIVPKQAKIYFNSLSRDKQHDLISDVRLFYSVSQ